MNWNHDPRFTLNDFLNHFDIIYLTFGFVIVFF